MVLKGLPIPISVLTDSYKNSHGFQYPSGDDGTVTEMVAYGEFRGSFNKDEKDQRIVFYGIRYAIENFVSVQWTMEDVENMANFLSTHNAGNTPYPFPKHLFEKFVKENNGYFPVIIESLPEGSVIYPHIPIYQISALGEYAPLVTFLETIMTQIWYPCTVATLSRKSKQIIVDKFDDANVPQNVRWIEEYKLHDFGFRGCTCVEQSVIGGIAHLLNFKGTDTESAAYYAQYHLNGGKPVGESIPATEHSVMLSFEKKDGILPNKGHYNEKDAIQNMADKFGNGLFACVMDTFDFHNTIFKLVPLIKKNGPMVLRPDSGTPKEVVLDAMIAIEVILSQDDKFHQDASHCVGKNGTKYLMFDGFSVIQGDGVDLKAIEEVLSHIMNPENRKKRIETLYKGKFYFEGQRVKYHKGFLIDKKTKTALLCHDVAYSPFNCTFGMGGGLLQKVNRDTMRFATKLNCVELDVKGEKVVRNVMKDPKTDPGKRSLPGKLAVKLVNGVPTVFPKSEVQSGENIMEVVYNGYIGQPIPDGVFTESFDTIRQRIETTWKSMPPLHDAVSDEIKQLQKKLSV
jgi:nicotinamide phosphoribosyltransferase